MHNDKSEAFAEFIELATDINDTNPSIYDGNTLLFSAAQNGNLDIITILIDKGADANNTIYYALKNNYLDAAFNIIQRLNFNINEPDKFGRTLLFTAAQNNNLDVAAKLIGLGADINKTTFMVIALYLLLHKIIILM